MDPEVQDCMKLSALVCAIVSFVIILIISWDTVEPTEWGVKYNSITKNIEADYVYDSGRYFVLPFSSFINFPRTLKTLEFSNRPEAQSKPLNSRTSEGLELELHLSFQYQLIKNELPSLYALANVDYESTFGKIASDSLRQIAGHFEASRYWRDRTFIGEEMKKQLNIELKRAHATCVYLQIMQVDLPPTYEDSIVQTQVEVQNSKIKKFEQEAAIIRQEIDILTSQTNQEIKYIDATAQADSYLLRQTATAEATQNIINAETEQFKILKETLGLNETELNTFVFLNGLMDGGGNLFVGFTNNMFVNQNIK